MPHLSITNFTSDWKDGVVLGCLTDIISGGQFPEYELMNPDDPLGNARKSMDYAETLGVQKTITPEEFTDPLLHSMQLMTCIMHFRETDTKLSHHISARISASGPGITGGKARRETNFNIKERIPSWATLEINITAPDGGKVNHQQIQRDLTSKTIIYTPSTHGTYRIEVRIGCEHIKGSPFLPHFTKLSFNEGSPFTSSFNRKQLASKCHLISSDIEHANEEYDHVVFIVSVEGAGDGNLTAYLENPRSGESQPVQIDDVEPYTHKVHFDLGKEFEYQLVIKYGGQHIEGSPFILLYEDDADASACRAEGDGLETSLVDKEASFKVYTEGAGEGDVTVTITAAESCPEADTQAFQKEENWHTDDSVTSEALETEENRYSFTSQQPEKEDNQFSADTNLLEMAEIDEGSSNFQVSMAMDFEYTINTLISKIAENEYTVNYTPTKPGKYAISVKFANQEIQNSPFSMRCYIPLNATDLAVVTPPTEAFIDSPIFFKVYAVNDFNGEGEVEIKARSQKQEISGTVEKEHDGDYLCTIEPKVAAKYQVKITLNGENITGSPFSITVRNPPRPENVIVYGSGLNDGYVQEKGNITIETEKAGSGSMVMKVHGPNGAVKINMKRHPENSRTILAQYTPKYVGEYTIHITWSKVHINGSPFTVNIQQETQKDETNIIASGGEE